MSGFFDTFGTEGSERRAKEKEEYMKKNGKPAPERTIHMVAGRELSESEADARYKRQYGDKAMESVLAARRKAAANGYDSLAEYNAMERQDPLSQQDMFRKQLEGLFKGGPMIHPSYDGGMYWPGGTASDNYGLNRGGGMIGPAVMVRDPITGELISWYESQRRKGGYDGSGINPGGMYDQHVRNPGMPYRNEFNPGMPYQQPSNDFNWDRMFSVLAPMLLGGGYGSYGYGGFDPFMGMGMGNFNPYGGFGMGGFGNPFGSFGGFGY